MAVLSGQMTYKIYKKLFTPDKKYIIIYLTLKFNKEVFYRMKVETSKKKKVEIRISEEDYKYLKVAAYSMGQSVSGMLRMISQASINAAKIQVQQGKIKLEDIETLYNDKL